MKTLVLVMPNNYEVPMEFTRDTTGQHVDTAMFDSMEIPDAVSEPGFYAVNGDDWQRATIEDLKEFSLL